MFVITYVRSPESMDPQPGSIGLGREMLCIEAPVTGLSPQVVRDGFG